MNPVWRFIRRWWWTIVAVAASVGIGLFFLFLGDGSGNPELPKSNLKERAEKEVEVVRLEGEVEKARVSARAEAQHEELNRIEELGKEDPVEARKQLSGFLNRNL